LPCSGREDLSQREAVLDYREFELQIFKNGPERYLASAVKDGKLRLLRLLSFAPEG
jgi:hypothetical protein